MANTVQLKKNGQIVYPITDRSCIIGLEEGPVMSCRYAWDGTTTPDVTKIPAGVTVEYNSNNYTGTLAASASTVGYQYLVYNSTSTEFDRYATDATGGSYAWKPMGDTTIQSPDIADNLTTNDSTKALSAKQGKILNEELGELEHKVSGLKITDAFVISATGEHSSSTGMVELSSPLSPGNYVFLIESGTTGNTGEIQLFVRYSGDNSNTSLGKITIGVPKSYETVRDVSKIGIYMSPTVNQHTGTMPLTIESTIPGLEQKFASLAMHCLKGWILSESFILRGTASWGEDGISSPVNISWPDGEDGVLTITRTNGLVTQIDASYSTDTYRLSITRNSDGNAISETFVKL